MARTRTPKPLDPQVLNSAARVLRVLAHADRLRMVEILMHQEVSVGQLAEMVELPAPAVSQHLNHMAAHGIVEKERRDRQVFYRVVNTNACHLVECLRKHGDGCIR
jgi:DNA-binding transcriptional ArsR family regulator